MANINEVYKLVQFIANKQQRGNITPAQFNTSAAAVNIQYMKERLGLPEQYQPGRPIPNIAYEITQRIKEDMRYFRQEAPLTIDRFGRASYPSDYIYNTSMRKKVVLAQSCDTDPEYTFVEVEIVDDDKEAYRAQRSSIVPASMKYPIAVLKQDHIQFYPTNLGSVTLTYLRMPQTPSWAYTLVNNRPVYDPMTSVNFEWPDLTLVDLAYRVLSQVGINLGEPLVNQYAEQKIATGQ